MLSLLASKLTFIWAKWLRDYTKTMQSINFFLLLSLKELVNNMWNVISDHIYRLTIRLNTHIPYTQTNIGKQIGDEWCFIHFSSGFFSAFLVVIF